MITTTLLLIYLAGAAFTAASIDNRPSADDWAVIILWPLIVLMFIGVTVVNIIHDRRR